MVHMFRFCIVCVKETLIWPNPYSVVVGSVVVGVEVVVSGSGK